MTHKVGMKGQVVIPKEIRQQIGISPGDEVEFEAEGRSVRVIRTADDPRRRRERLEALRGAWADIPGLSTADLEAERRKERELEERRARQALE